MKYPSRKFIFLAFVVTISLVVPFVFLKRNKLLPAAAITPKSLALSHSAATVPAADAQTKQQVQAKLNKLPISFIENKGQLDARVAFYVQGSDKTLYFTPQGITYALTEAKAPPATPKPESFLQPASFRPEVTAAPQKWHVVKLDFIGANPNVKPKGVVPTEATMNYFKGSKEQWKTGLKTYAKIVYEELWPGIDLEYSGTVNQMKYQFVVKPGADPQQIRLAYRGASSVKLNAQGQLDVATSAGAIQDDAPYAYQEEGGQRVEIKAAYALGKKAGSKTQGYGFEVGAYDKRKPLVLDPAVLIYCGYIGGSGYDYANGIAVDTAGNAYVAGSTQSRTDFPVSVGPDLTFNANFNGGADAFVAKVKADGTGLVYCGYLGGASGEQVSSIAVDAMGNAYVTGSTNSDQKSFPVTVGPKLTYDGRNDAFVAKVRADGTGLVYCGYIGGGEYDQAYGIAVDAAGNAYVAGWTESNQSSSFPFPVAVGPDLTFNGGSDAFVAKVKADGTGFAYCGYLGGAGVEQASSIAVDASGNAYVTGYTRSNEASFPVTIGPDLTFNGIVNVDSDSFVAKVKADGTGLVYCGYIGGSGNEEAYGIAVDSTGNAYVTGATVSDQTSFPVTVGPDLTSNGNFDTFKYDAFVAKVRADGTGLIYCGYIGGSEYDQANGIAVDATGNAYVAGYTYSDQTSFPVTIGPKLTLNGSNDAFIAKVRADGTALVYCGYIGGLKSDVASGIAIDAAGSAYVAGYTYSDQSSFPVTIGPDLTFNGPTDPFNAQSDTFVAKISAFDPGCNVVIATQPQSQTILRGQTALLHVTTNGAAPFAYQWYEGVSGNTSKPVGTNADTFTTPALTSASSYWVRVTNACSSADSETATITVHSNLEADLAPRPYGNGTVSITDWTQTGRFVIGLDTPEGGYEFQRADCSPRDTLGDGKITLADWVQAGRYAVGLDPATTIGGPTTQNLFAPLTSRFPTTRKAQPRMLRAREANFSRGQIGVLAIEWKGQGNENALAFSLDFDPQLLSFVDAAVGDDVQGAALQVQSSLTANGRLACALALPPGQQLSAGTHTLLTLRFLPRGGTGEEVTNISFSDALLTREIVDVLATPIASATYTGSTITISGSAAAQVSAASYLAPELAADSLASAFGTKLATTTASAESALLPNTLGGTTVKVRDSQGTERLASLFFVSPTQINYQIPAGTAEGIATLTITNSAGEVTSGVLNIGAVAPGIFSADASGQGWAAADVVYVKRDQSQVIERVARFVEGQFVPVPIDLSADTASLSLFGTGIRHCTNLANVKVKIGGIDAVIDYADTQGQYSGLDQINVRVPKGLLGRGMVDVEVEVEGKTANTVHIAIK